MAETNKVVAAPESSPPVQTVSEPQVQAEGSFAPHRIPRQASGHTTGLQAPEGVDENGRRWLTLQRSAGNYALSRLVQRQPQDTIPQPGPATQAALSSRGNGGSLPAGTRGSLETSLGHDLGDVRVHTDREAGQAAEELQAAAFTSGQDIFFGAGNYAAGSTSGRELLAHEVVHTIQQRGAPERPSPAPTTISQPGEPLEQQAAAVAHQVATGQPVNTAILTQAGRQTQSHTTWRADGGPSAATTPPTPATTPAAEAAAPGAPTEEVSLATATFMPSEALTASIAAQGRQGASIPVRLGNLARGSITIRKDRETYRTTGDGYQAVPLILPVLQPLRNAGVDPVLALRLRNSAFEGYASIATQRGAAGNPAALVNWMKDHAQEMGWLGMDVSRFPSAANELRDGVLRLQVNNFQFRLGGFLNGSGNFGLENEMVTFDANATVHVQGLTDAQLAINRNAEGKLNGQVEAPVSISKFSGNVLARYADGTVDVRGTVRYTDEKFNGEITLLVTDAATARNVALQHLGPDAVLAAGEQSSGVTGEVRPGPRALAGWGALDFAFTEWLTGKAQVIVDNEGHITVIGEITPQAEVELFAQRDYIVEIFTLEVRARYGVPLVGSIFLFANVGMQALAKFGPGKIYNIAIRGRYSTDPRVFNEFSIEGTLNISAFAGLRMRAEGGAGLELLGHDIKAGVGVNALAGVRGYVEATPTLGYRERAAPDEGKAGEFYIKGHMELAAQPFLGLSGDLFVELDSPWWSPAPDKKWTWPIGSLEYPLPGEFGIGADVDYVIGSDQLPEIQFGEVDFNKDKFMTDLINDKVPPKSQGEQEKQGEWQEGETTGVAADPTLVSEGGAPEAEPATGQQQPGEGEPPSPEVQERWLNGLQALGQLATESQRNPLDRAALDARLAAIKNTYGFSSLRVETAGEDWMVYPAMSPPSPNPVKVEGSPTAMEADGESCLSPGVSAPGIGSEAVHGSQPPRNYDGPRLHHTQSEHIIPFATARSLRLAVGFTERSRRVLSRFDRGMITLMIYRGAAERKNNQDNVYSAQFESDLRAAQIPERTQKAQQQYQGGNVAGGEEIGREVISSVTGALETLRQSAVDRTQQSILAEWTSVEPGCSQTNGQRRNEANAVPGDGTVDRVANRQLDGIIDLVSEALRASASQEATQQTWEGRSIHEPGIVDELIRAGYHRPYQQPTGRWTIARPPRSSLRRLTVDDAGVMHHTEE